MGERMGSTEIAAICIPARFFLILMQPMVRHLFYPLAVLSERNLT